MQLLTKPFNFANMYNRICTIISCQSVSAELIARLARTEIPNITRIRASSSTTVTKSINSIILTSNNLSFLVLLKYLSAEQVTNFCSLV